MPAALYPGAFTSQCKEKEIMRLSILIPLYNAGMTIRELCKEIIRSYCHSCRLEIMLINDGSSDHTDAVCRELHEQYPDIVTYISLARNFGEHNALVAGMNYVSGDYCIMMDDDFQNPPEEIADLIAEIQKGYDVVYTYYPVRQDSILRQFVSRLHNFMATLILKKPADLYLSSFKIINRLLIDEIRKYSGPDPYVDGIILRSTNRIGKVPVVHRKRMQNSSGYTFGKLVSLWRDMVINFSLYPLRILGVVGLVMMIIGTVNAVHTVVELISPAVDPTEYERLTAVISFYRGIQLFAISIVGEYVGRIYKTLSREPQFIARDILLRAGQDARVTDSVHARR